MADNTPVEDKIPTSAPTAEVQPEATKEVEIPTFAKSTKDLPAETEVTPEVESAPAPDQTETEDAVMKKRLSGAISEVEKKNEEVRKHVELQAEFVRENNDLIHKIAASDPKLANQIVSKVWGGQGVNSYKQLLERSKLEELKVDDPASYEIKKDLYDLKSKLAERDQKDQAQIRAKFLQEQGIQENDYDPNYRKLMEALEDVNPNLLSADYKKALKVAHLSAFADGVTTPKSIEVPTLRVGGGSKPAPLPTAQPQFSSQTSWLAEQLNKKHGYKISL